MYTDTIGSTLPAALSALNGPSVETTGVWPTNLGGMWSTSMQKPCSRTDRCCSHNVVCPYARWRRNWFWLPGASDTAPIWLVR